MLLLTVADSNWLTVNCASRTGGILEFTAISGTTDVTWVDGQRARLGVRQRIRLGVRETVSIFEEKQITTSNIFLILKALGLELCTEGTNKAMAQEGDLQCSSISGNVERERT